MYNYQVQKQNLFTDEGQRKFLKVRDNVLRLISEAGAVRMDKATAGVSGENWDALACVDRMVELGEITEVVAVDRVPGQYRIFTSFKM
jgi:hypothetical protein